MRFLLRKNLFVQALELALNALDLLSCRFALLAIELRCPRPRCPPLRAVHNRGHHLQVAQQFRSCGRGGFHFLPLRLEKQLRLIEDAFADRARSFAPGRIELAGLARVAVILGEDRGHPLAILQALPRHRHQKLHGHLRQDLAPAHLLLDGLRQ
jgi:hypothetical protein